jgi:hypothetical protein
MSHEKEGKEKSGKKAPARSLKEKRAAKAAKRHELESPNSIILKNAVPRPGKL